jgi:hypothetical protein
MSEDVAADAGLRRDAIGLREVLFQSITAMAPAAAVAASIPSGAVFAGGSLPLAVLIALVSYAGPIVAVWMAAGVVVLLVLMRRHPERISETARVHLDDASPTDPAQNGAARR